MFKKKVKLTMSYWFLEQDTFRKMNNAIENGYVASESEKARFEEKYSNPITKVVNNQGFIDVSGVLTKKPDIMAMLFGGGNCTYSSIIDSVNLLDNDKSVSEIILNIDSPGGSVNGMFETMYAIRDSVKPVKAVVSGMCASAAYGLASQASEIKSTSVANFVGSIGVATSVYIDDNIIDITSSNAPNKRPDARTDAGKKIIQDELDAIESLFMEAIAQGRGVSEDIIKNNFGKGGVLLAKDALKMGMIDGIVSEYKTKPKKKVVSMDLETFKAQHADLYAEIEKHAISKERDRVTAHLLMGEASGDIKTAIEAVKDGSEMTATLQAQYMVASMNKRDVDNRNKDDEDIVALNDLKKDQETALTPDEKAMEMLLKEWGV